jgi:hypothetical protein
MARKQHIAAIALLLTVTSLVAAALGGVYVAMGRVRPFYVQALQLDPQTLEVGSRELESRATALYSEARQPGEWRAAFTANQINGWLALKLAEVYADALPGEISEPRVAIGDDRLTLGFRARRGGAETVVSADASVMLTDDGDVAIRLPVLQVAEDVSQACQKLSLPVRWTQDNGQPVALVSINQDSGKMSNQLLLDAVELRDGAIYLAGHTVANETAAKDTFADDPKAQVTNP